MTQNVVSSPEHNTIQTRPWDPADHLKTDEDMTAYLDAALEDGDASVILAVLGDIKRVNEIAYMAREADTRLTE